MRHICQKEKDLTALVELKSVYNIYTEGNAVWEQCPSI